MVPPLLLSLVLACGAPPAPAPPAGPDLVLITLDTVRADRLGAYGDPLARTPNLDAAAARGALFREAYSPIPLTLPAHTTLLTGLQPHHHGLRDNGGFRLPPDVPTIAVDLQAAGWHTGAFVAAYVLDRAWGLDRGFDVYDAPFHPEDVSRAAFGTLERPGREVVREALAWWESTPSPRFAWVHLYDAHFPYAPGDEWSGDPYRGELWEVDRALRPLLAATEDAVVVVAGDHGESLWDQGELMHGLLLNRSSLRVPLIVRPPGGLEGTATPSPREVPPRPKAWAAPEGLGPDGLVLAAVPDAPTAAVVVDTPVGLADVAPTLMDYAGLPWTSDGRSLRPAVEGAALVPRPVTAETLAPLLHFGWSPAFLARDGDRLLRRGTTDVLTDPVADPWGTAPLDEAPPAPLIVDTDALAATPATPGPVDPDSMALLEALGYATAVVAPSSEPVDAVDAMPALQELDRAQALLDVDAGAAEVALVELLTEWPGMVDGWFSLAVARASQGDAAGAIDAYDEVLSRSPTHLLAVHNRGVLLRAVGRDAEALDAARALELANPSDPRGYRLEASLWARAEDPSRVQDAVARGRVTTPDDPYLLYVGGLAALQLGDHRQALELLGAAREHGSRAPDLSLWEGAAHEALGEVDAAVTSYHQAARDTPTDVRPVVAAGLLLAREERCPEALPYLFTATERGVRDPRVQEAARTCGGR